MNKLRYVLITGCSSGFGYLLALKYAREGYTTYASVRDPESSGVEELKIISKKEKLPLQILHIDVTDNKSVEKAIGSINGDIDILINNAGFGYLGPVEDFTIEEIKKQYETNIFGMLRMIKACTPQMRKNKKGIIINISSINGLIPFPLWGIYSSSKYAVESLTEALRFELSHFGIKTLLIEPGSYLTRFTDNRKFAEQTLTGESAYGDLTKRFFYRFNKANEQVKKGFLTKFFDPNKVTDKIFKLSLQDNPPFRTITGFDAKLQYAIRRILPHFLWEKMLKMVYKW